jgi:hypothetical protein
MNNRYDNINDYIMSVFNVFKLVNKKAEIQGDKRLKMIGLTIYNYAKYMSYEFNINLDEQSGSESINLIPIFEYIAANNIELLDFSNININDIDIRKKEDLERFVLSHIYYITQGNK